jgi:hypothetical protein
MDEMKSEKRRSFLALVAISADFLKALTPFTTQATTGLPPTQSSWVDAQTPLP